MSDRVVPSLAPFTAPQYEDVSFPIDAVYTWVDGNDPAWLTRRAAMVGKLVTGTATLIIQRDTETGRNWRFSSRLLVKYAPWVRHIYLVTHGSEARLVARHTSAAHYSRSSRKVSRRVFTTALLLRHRNRLAPDSGNQQSFSLHE